MHSVEEVGDRKSLVASGLGSLTRESDRAD